MAEGKTKRDWFRWLVDLLVLAIFAMLTWAGTVLWEMTTTQAVTSSNQKQLAESIKQIQVRNASYEKRMMSIELWKAETSGNRFTSEDGMEMWRELQELKEYVIALPMGVPPGWFVDRVNELAERIETLEHRLNNKP